MEEPEDILFTEISRARPSRGSGRMSVHVEVFLAAGYATSCWCVAVASTSWPATRTPAQSATAPPDFLPSHARRLDLPRGPDPHPERNRPRATAGSLPCKVPDPQPLPAKRLHRSDEGPEVVRAMDPGPIRKQDASTAHCRGGAHSRPYPRGRGDPQPHCARTRLPRRRAGGRRLGRLALSLGLP